MAKSNSGGEKTKETQVTNAKPAEAKPAESKKQETKEQPQAKGPGGRNKGHEALPGHCSSWNCKAKADRFNFCDEHYEHFKFGLIKKTGEPVSDYEKKFEHYQAFKARRNAQKVA